MDKPRITIRLSPSQPVKPARRTEPGATEAGAARPERLAADGHVPARAVEPDRPSLPPEATRNRPAPIHLPSHSLSAFRVRRNGRVERRPWTAVAYAAVPLVGAIGIGVLLGWSMLTLLQEPGNSAPTAPAAAHVPASPPAAPTGSNGTPQAGDSAKPAPPSNSVPLASDGSGPSGTGVPASPQAQAAPPARSLVVVQAGVFQTREAAERMRQTLAARGVPAVLVEGTPLRLLVGVAPDRDSARNLATALRAQNVETYVPRDGLAWPGVKAEGDAGWTRFLETGDRLFDRLARVPPSALEGGQDVLPPKQEIEALHRSLLEAGQPLAVGDGPREKRARAMMNALTQAVTAVRQYAANPHPGYVWVAEQGLLQYAVLRAASSP